MTDKEQEILDYLDGKLLGMAGNYPIVFAQMKEKINVKRSVYSNELIKAIDERLTKYEELIK